MRAKRLIIAFVLAALPLAESLADGVRFLVVNGKDGTKTTFALADNPKDILYLKGSWKSCQNGRKRLW